MKRTFTFLSWRIYLLHFHLMRLIELKRLMRLTMLLRRPLMMYYNYRIFYNLQSGSQPSTRIVNSSWWLLSVNTVSTITLSMFSSAYVAKLIATSTSHVITTLLIILIKILHFFRHIIYIESITTFSYI